MSRHITLVLILSLLALQGCATLSESECISGNWYQLGYQDGKYGRDADYVLKHEAACIEYSVTINRDDYESGRQKGIELYCNSHNGYQFGNGGRHPNPNCGAHFTEYYDNYKRGLDARYSRIARKLSELQREYDALTIAIGRIKNQEERDRIEAELEELSHQIDDAEVDLDKVEALLRQYS